MLLLVLAATMGLLLMQAMYDDFGDLLDVGAGAVDIAFYFAVKLPSYLSVVMPIAILLSLLYTMGALHRNLEITALSAAGVSLGRMTRGIWWVGIGLCGVSWMLSSTVIPWSVEEARSVWQGLQFRDEARTESADRVGVVPNVTFENRAESRVWFMNRYSRYTDRGYGVTVTELDDQRRETTRMMAREAYYDGGQSAWVFREGRETWLDVETGEVMRTKPFTERVVSYYQEDPSLMLVVDVDPMDLSFFELRRLIAFYTAENSPKLTAYVVRYYGMLADTLGPLIIIAIAIPFAVSGVRVNPAVGISKSIGLFALYFVLVKLSITLGAKGLITPWIAALGPNTVMLGLGVFFMFRRR